MQFDSKSGTLLRLTSEDISRAAKVDFSSVGDFSLLAYDSNAASFWFEFSPVEDIDAFINNARFGTFCDNQLMVDSKPFANRMNYDDMNGLPALPIQHGPDLQLPLRCNPIRTALTQIAETACFRGQLTKCECGISGCFAQYAVVDSFVCQLLFTVSGASLASVDWRPFRFKLDR